MNKTVVSPKVSGSHSASKVATLRSLTSTRRPKLETMVAAVFYLGFACYLTWPLVTGLGHIIYGAAGDPYGTMAFYRELVDHHHNPFLPGTISQLSAPEGQPIPWPRDLASLPGVAALYLLTAIFGAIPADGIYILLGYTLTGIVTFIVVRKIIKDSWIALITGWAFAFFPFATINGQGHVDLIQGWVLVLGIWRMLELIWYPTFRNGVLAGAAVVLGMWWTPYFILLGGVAYLVTVLVVVAISLRQHNFRVVIKFQAVAAALVGLFALFLGILSTVGVSSIGVRAQGLQELNTYSARPLEYLLPDIQSPLFGRYTAHYLLTHMHGSNRSEATLYVGITVIILALIAVGYMIRSKLTSRLHHAILVLSAITVSAIVTSAPPDGRVFGMLVPFPSHFISDVTSTWRVYSRFVVVAMLALSVLAAIGLHAITRSRTQRARIVIMLIASVAIPLDLWARLDGRTNTIEVPGIYKTLSRQPAGLVAEYPLTPAGYNNYGDVFFQNVYEKPMINGYLEGSSEERRALSLANLSDPRTASRLATLGVRYVIVDAAPPAYGLPRPGRPGAGFRLIEHEPYADLYLVTAHASGIALSAAGEGFSNTESAGAGEFNWLEQNPGIIELEGRCAACEGLLVATVASFGQARVVTVLDGNGHVLVRRRVTAPTQLSVPLRFTKSTLIKIVTRPGPQSIIKTIGGTDTRSVSISVGNLEFRKVTRSGFSASNHRKSGQAI